MSKQSDSPTPNALVMSKLPPTSNYVLLLCYYLQHSRTSTSNPQFPGPPLPGICKRVKGHCSKRAFNGDGVKCGAHEARLMGDCPMAYASLETIVGRLNRVPWYRGLLGVEPVMGPTQWRYTSMGYAQSASSPMGGFAYSPTWGMRGPPPGPVPQLDMESASNAGGRVIGQVAAIERIQGENTDPLTVRQQEKLPERRLSPAVSEQSWTSSRRLPTPPVQSLNLPPPRRGSSLSSHEYAQLGTRTNFPVQPLSEMTLRLEDIIRIQECTPEDVAMVLGEILESMGIKILGDGLEFADLRVQFVAVGTQLEIDLPEKAQQWLMTPANRSDFLWLYNVLLDPERMLELIEAEARYGQSLRNSRGILPLLPHTHGREKELTTDTVLRI
ncbi:hypothetical protein F5877DRAFT_73206 [Lentinula edodes]|nr:hypothetical protein F5877DRAFT_73206 [Lentinula edodes]